MIIMFDEIVGNTYLEGRLLYHSDEYSFDFHPKSQLDVISLVGNQETTTLSVGTLQVEIGIATKCILYVWGYHPYLRWNSGALSVPKAQKGCLQATLNLRLMPGVSIPLIEDGHWPTTYDSKNGWLCVGDRELLPDDSATEFASSTIAVLRKRELVALWLKPDMTTS